MSHGQSNRCVLGSRLHSMLDGSRLHSMLGSRLHSVLDDSRLHSMLDSHLHSMLGSHLHSVLGSRLAVTGADQIHLPRVWILCSQECARSRGKARRIWVGAALTARAPTGGRLGAGAGGRVAGPPLVRRVGFEPASPPTCKCEPLPPDSSSSACRLPIGGSQSARRSWEPEFRRLLVALQRREDEPNQPNRAQLPAPRVRAYRSTKIKLHFATFRLLPPEEPTCFDDAPHVCSAVRAAMAPARLQQCMDGCLLQDEADTGQEAEVSDR